MKSIPIFAIILLFAVGRSNASTLVDLLRNGTRLEWTYLRNGVRYYMTPDITADVIDSERQRFNVSYTIWPPTPMDEDIPLPSTTDDDTPNNPVNPVHSRPRNTTQMDQPLQDTTQTTATPPPTTTTPTTTRGPTTTPPPLPGQMRTQFQTDPSRFVAVQGETLVKASSPSQYLFLHPVAGSDNEFHLYYNNTPFVTPRTRAPFDFFLRQRFPDEPPAIFSVGK
ncbi:Serine/threonine-protein kinase MPS1 [Folsomia candida]|uniref:Serine/threonine-protein kinase MPS1 n=1 Tax=Folsomia candida TaxID=158441 RepID=A0A226DKP1_FOLCA|nr:Serine/threonine-protein kinase MPS1 [Folsomia candida]